MPDHLAVTIPLKDIQRIQLYINTARRSLSQIQRETGADYILNGTLYNMSTFVPNCHLKADGKVLCKPAYTVSGYSWNDGPDISMDTLPDASQRNYITCTPLIVSGKPVINPDGFFRLAEFDVKLQATWRDAELCVRQVFPYQSHHIISFMPVYRSHSSQMSRICSTFQQFSYPLLHKPACTA